MTSDQLATRLLNEPDTEARILSPSGEVLPIQRIGQSRSAEGSIVLTIEAGRPNVRPALPSLKAQKS